MLAGCASQKETVKKPRVNTKQSRADDKSPETKMKITYGNKSSKMDNDTGSIVPWVLPAKKVTVVGSAKM